jgi:hypothetical protein
MSFRSLTERERRTIRIAGIGIAIYLTLFGGLQAWNYINQKRSDYLTLLKQAEALKQQVRVYDDKVLVLKKMMQDFHMDPAKLSRVSVVAEASAAIQKAAMAGGVPLGPIRESPGRPSSRELASIQIEAMGQVPALMNLLQRMESLGYPLVIDSVQITADARQPGMVKVNLTILILDFDQWKKEGSNVAAF